MDSREPRTAAHEAWRRWREQADGGRETVEVAGAFVAGYRAASEQVAALREALSRLREAAIKVGPHVAVVGNERGSAAFERLCDAIDAADDLLARRYRERRDAERAEDEAERARLSDSSDPHPQRGG